MSGSCDKHLSFFVPLRLWGFRHLSRGCSIRRLGRQVRKEEWSKVRGRRRYREEKKSERDRVIHSNTSSTLFARLSLANRTSSGLFQKKGFVIRVFSDSWLLSLAANYGGRRDAVRGGMRREWQRRWRTGSAAKALVMIYPVALTGSATAKQQPEAQDGLKQC